MKTQTALFETASYLDSEDAIEAYLNEILDAKNPDLLLAAIGNIAKARGMDKVAADAGLGRECLSEAFAPGSKPNYDTVFRVIQALGVRFSISPKA